MPDQTVGQRIRQIRTQRGMSLQTLAERAHLNKGYLSRVERGERSIDQRRTLHDVADALEVSVTTLTGQPYDPNTKAEDVVRVAVVDIRGALYGNALGERYEDPTRDIETLTRVVAKATALGNDAAFAEQAPMLATLITDLYAHAADGPCRPAALPLLADVLEETCRLMRIAGQFDLGAFAGERATAAAEAADDPVRIGSSRYFWTQLLMHIDHAPHRAAAVATRACGLLEPGIGDGQVAQVYGMLHLIGSYATVITGDLSTADTHLEEAADTAARTGEGTARRLWFGPNNVATWRIPLAVERGDSDLVAGLATAVDFDALPSKNRQAEAWIDLGRGLAIAGERTAAERAFAKAERLAPLRTRMSPHVREKVAELYHTACSDHLRQMARRMGVIPT